MSKLGYKQKGISMLTTPGTGIGGTVGNLLKNIAVNKQLKKEKPAGERKLKDMSSVGDGAKEYNDRVTKIYDTMRNRGNDPKSTEVKALGSSGYGIEGSGYKDTSSNKLTGSGYDKKEDVQTTKTKRTFGEAYQKRDMKTYGNLSQAEYTTEAKRQLKGGKVPGSQMKGGNAAKVETKNRYSNESLSEVNDLLKVNPVDKDGSGKRTDSKPAAKSMSREEIKNQKDASKKEGKMSRKEIRLQKLNSKAASTKRSTNETIKSIDPTKAKSADTGAKQTSARATRAIAIDKKARLEKKAGKLKSRIEIQKNNRAKRKANKEIRANR
jgi:hypothetical protein